MSFNIGDIAVALTERDSERLTLRNELNKLEDLQANGTDTLLRFAATSIQKDGLDAQKVVYSYSIDHTSIKHNGKGEGEVVEFQLLSEKDIIDVIAEVSTTNSDGEKTTLTYIAQFPTSKVPATAQTDNVVEVTEETTPKEDVVATSSTSESSETKPEVTETPTATAPVAAEWANLSLDAVDGDDADSTASIHVTAKRIMITEAIAEKTKLLDQKVAEIAAIQQQLKEAQTNAAKEQKTKSASASATNTKKKATTSSATSKRKATGTKAKKTTKSSANDDDGDNEDEEGASSNSNKLVVKKASFLPSFTEVQAYVLNGGMMALNLALTNRAFVFFGLAAVGVYTYGDYASV